MNLRDELLAYSNDPKNQPVSIQEIAQYAQKLHAREYSGALFLLANIREAAGDTEGRLMQDELVDHIAELWADAQRYRAFFDAGLPITFMGCD